MERGRKNLRTLRKTRQVCSCLNSSETCPDSDWGLHVRLAQAMQAEEKWLRHCFLCQSPDHLMRDCLTAKMGKGP